MSFLSSAGVSRRLMLFGARLVLQGAMVCSIPHTGMDELPSGYCRVPYETIDPSMVLDRSFTANEEI
jgi:hypothetical protein